VFSPQAADRIFRARGHGAQLKSSAPENLIRSLRPPLSLKADALRGRDGNRQSRFLRARRLDISCGHLGQD
jgi:hypothetical protein